MRRPLAVLSTLALGAGLLAALGPAGATTAPTPAPLHRVSTADGTTVVIGTDGRVRGTGGSADGQLGGTSTLTTLTEVPGLPVGTTAVSVEASGTNVVVLGSDGVTYASGSNLRHQVRAGATDDIAALTPVEWLAGVTPVDVDTTDGAIVAVLPDGTLKAAGLNRSGRLSSAPGSELAPTLLDPLPGGELAVEADMSFYGTVVRTASGKVYTRGASVSGQLASPTGAQETVWTLDALPDPTTVTAVSLADDHLVVLGANGLVYGSGSNADGVIGQGNDHDQMVSLGALPGGADAVAVSTGLSHTLAIGDDGRLYGVGNNAYGQLPDHPSSLFATQTFSWVPLASAVSRDVVDVSAGFLGTVLLDDDGVAFGSGDNGGALSATAGQVTDGASGEADSVSLRLLSGQRLTSERAPAVGGDVRVSGTVTADPGAWSPSARDFSYQWFADDTAIGGATSRTYTPGVAQLGRRLTVQVTARRGRFVDATASSAPSSPVAVGAALVYDGTPTPKVVGTLRSGRTLRISLTSTELKQGFDRDATGLAYRWYRNGSKVSGRTGATYKLGSADKGKRIQVRVYGSLAGYATGSYLTPSVKIAR